MLIHEGTRFLGNESNGRKLGGVRSREVGKMEASGNDLGQGGGVVGGLHRVRAKRVLWNE